MKKRVLSFALAFALTLALVPVTATAAGSPGDYNADDIAVINAIIENNGLNWTEADPADGSYIPADWEGVRWTDEATDARIRSLNVRYENLTGTLDVSNLTALTLLWCDFNQLTTLDVSKNTALEVFSCGSNQLTSLDVSKNTALTLLNCEDNQLTALDVSKNTALTDLFCSQNQLTTLDVTKNTALTLFTCFSNQLTALDVSKNTALTLLSCGYNQLTALDVSGCAALESLRCEYNEITSLDVSKNTALEFLCCSYNQITSLNVSGLTALGHLDCGNNKLTSLDVSSNTALEELWCNSNKLTALDVSSNTALEYLWCAVNQLTSLDVSNNTALEYLWCWDNKLTSLDVSKNTALERLNCEDNELTSLALNPTAPYEYINVSYNYLPGKSAVTGKAIDWDGVNFIFDPQNTTGGGGDGGNGGGNTPNTPDPSPSPSPSPDPPSEPEKDDATVTVAAPDGQDTASIPNNTLNEIRQNRLELEVTFTDEDGEAVGSFVFSAEAAGQLISDAKGGGVNVSLKTVDTDTLDIPEALEGRPVYEFSVTDFNGNPITQFGGNVTITLPYTLAEGENPNAIVVYYVTDEGIQIVHGYYDAAKKAVVIKTDHFSLFAIGYNEVTFSDVPDDHPNKAAIDFLAAREIAAGKGGGLFGPDDSLTRAELLVLVMKAFGVKVEKGLEGFDDAKGTWYEDWVATARKLGITAGIGNNMFGLDRQVTREEMLLMIYNTLKALGELPQPGDISVSLGGGYSAWVYKDGNDEKIKAVLSWDVYAGGDPTAPYARAMMAQLLYNLLTR